MAIIAAIVVFLIIGSLMGIGPGLIAAAGTGWWITDKKQKRLTA